MMKIAQLLAQRGTCRKKQVGCVLVDTFGNILSTGYNGQPRGMPHCDVINPCPAYLDANLSCRAIHAETNALVRCHDVETIHAAYITEEPCEKCLLLLKNTSCKQVVFIDEHGFHKAINL
jgi:dCMP deaminase